MKDIPGPGGRNGSHSFTLRCQLFEEGRESIAFGRGASSSMATRTSQCADSLMLGAGLAIRIGIALGHFRAPDAVTFTRVTEVALGSAPSFDATLLSILFVLNLLLGAFNLLPVPPLDGSSGIMVLMSENTALKFLDWTLESKFSLLGLLQTALG